MYICKKRYMKYLLTIVLSVLYMFTQGQIPDGYYNGTEGLTGEALKTKLHEIIDNHEEFSYSDLRDFILRETDEDPNNPDNVILLYTGRSQPKNTFGGDPDDWNREHVWAKSHGGFGNQPPAGTDAHHIRPTDASVNSARGNKDFDDGGQAHNEATECYYDGDSWEPRDEVKGDVARMIFYMAVRYEGDDGVADLELSDNVNTSPQPEHGKLSTLLAWHNADPPNDFEINRNEVIYGYQKNRNPFIDHPEFANKIWGDPDSVAEITPSKVKSFPNPTKETFNVIINEGNYKKESVEVFSISGLKLNVDIDFFGNQITLKVEDLPKGLYFVKWNTTYNELKAIKFVRN